MPDVGGIAGDRLKSFVERIERLEEEQRSIANDKKEVYAEAKGTGFDTKIMRQIIRLRKMDKDDLDEQESLLDTYKRALGMLPAEEQIPSGETFLRAGLEGRMTAEDAADVVELHRTKKNTGKAAA